MCHALDAAASRALCPCGLDTVFCSFVLLQTTMPGMKRDCGGAAAILGAFRAAIKQVRTQVLPFLLQALSDPLPPGLHFLAVFGKKVRVRVLVKGSLKEAAMLDVFGDVLWLLLLHWHLRHASEELFSR